MLRPEDTHVNTNLACLGALLGALLSPLLGAGTAQAADYRPDVDAVEQLLAQDIAFNPAERQQAEAMLAELRRDADKLSAAEFQLRVAKLFALARNGHTMLLTGLWPSDFNRIPARIQVFADSVFILDADDRRPDAGP